jgi:hypothetical protein
VLQLVQAAAELPEVEVDANTDVSAVLAACKAPATCCDRFWLSLLDL